jgi:1-phosphatidylinositol phosphodiesterase
MRKMRRGRWRVEKEWSTAMRFLKPRFLVVATLAAAGLICLHGNPAAAHRHGAYSHDNYPSAVEHGSDWMGMLPDSWLISELSIPGTHDTMSHYGGDIVMTQTMRIDTQLERGVRAVDIRCRHIEDVFAIHHGSYFQHAMFGKDVLDVIIAFLGENPTETVLMRVSEARNPTGNTRSFAETFRWYMNGRQAWFWQPPSADYIPTLEEVRGRIVVLQQFTDPSGPVGLEYPDNDGKNDWTFSNDSFAVQDRYALSSNWSLIDSKWPQIKAFFGSTLNQSYGDRIYVNHLSAAEGGFPYFFASGHSNPATGAPRLASGRTTPGWSAGDFPKVNCFLGICTIAFEGTNILTHDFLGLLNWFYTTFLQELPPPVGVIMADFPGPALISMIIANNGIGLDVAPVADANGPYEGDEGSEIVLDGSASFDLGDDPLLYRWDFDTDGAWDTDWSSEPTDSHVWQDDWDGFATLEVDDGNWTATDEAPVLVRNVPPAVQIDYIAGPVDECILPSQELHFAGSFSDPGALDTHTAVWSFGDSTTALGTVTEENVAPDATGTVWDAHTYDDAGIYSIRLEVFDDDGAVGEASWLVKVRTPVEAVDCFSDFFQSLPDRALKGPAKSRKRAVSKKLAAVRRNVEAGNLRGAISKLLHDIRAKGDGTIDGKSGNDWIRDEDAQHRFCSMTDEIVKYLRSLQRGRTSRAGFSGKSNTADLKGRAHSLGYRTGN